MTRPFFSKPFQYGWIWLSFASGFAALVYQVLWVKQVTSIYGATARSVSITLVAFFLGLASGSYVWGKWSSKFSSPFRALALLELGIVVGNIVIYFSIAPIEYLSTVLLLNAEGWVSSGVIFFLVLLLLYPASFLMGGTYPLMVHAFSCYKKNSISTAVYGLNTAGACLGALLGGTILPLKFGYTGTGILALALTLSVVFFSWCLSQQSRFAPIISDNEGVGLTGSFQKGHSVWVLCFVSGFASLGLEVVWTHMFSQVLQNSVYTFACILTLFLLTQALGAALVNVWSRYRDIRKFTLEILLAAISVLVLATPFLFHWSTDGLTYLGTGEKLTFFSYLKEVLMRISFVLVLPSVAMGCFFPVLIYWCSRDSRQIGPDLGRWVSINTMGAIMGSFFTGFVLIPQFGTWTCIRLLACLYVFLLLLPRESDSAIKKSVATYAAILIIVLSMTVADPTKLPLVQIDRQSGESLLHVTEDEEGVVAVVKKHAHLNIIVNNSYTLGGTKSASLEEFQSDLPLVLRPQAKSVFYLGMGTGITAGASLRYDVDKVIITELVGNSIKASKAYFGTWNGGIFKDPRVQIVHGDGRQVLKYTSEKHDLIIADLFIPWKKGSGNLYSLEHFQNTLSRLKPGGLFAQWLPLYQITRNDFDIIAKTMLDVFPQVTVWRGDFFSKRPILCLVGHREVEAFDVTMLSLKPKRYNPLLLRRKLHRKHPKEGALLKHYIGCLNKEAPHWEALPLNTEDKPLIELLAPIHHRQVKAGEKSWFNEREYLGWMENFFFEIKRDPYLGNQPAHHPYVAVGLAHHRVKIMKKVGSPEEKARANSQLKEILKFKLQ